MRKILFLAAALVLASASGARAARAPSCGPLGPKQVEAAVGQVLDELRERLPEGAELRPGLIEAQYCERLPGRYEDVDVAASLGRRVGRQVRITLRLLDDAGRRVGQAYLRVDIELRLPTVVATQRLEPGAVLGEADVVVELRPQDTVPAGACTRAEQVLGLAVRKVIASGETLTERVLDRPVLVRRGAVVRAAVYSGPLRVMSRGIAQEEGRFGDHIRIKTTGGDRDFMGRVTRTGDVVVQL